MNFPAILICAGLASVCPAQTFQLGPVQVQCDNQSVVLSYHGHDWTPVLSKLSLPTAGCEPVAWDDLNEIIYLAFRKDGWTIAAYDLRADRTSAVAAYRGDYRGQAWISPLGRYLILAGSPARGRECQPDALILVDIDAHRLAPFHLPETPLQVASIRWTGPAHAAYAANSRPGCGVPTRSASGPIDLAAAFAAPR